MSILSTKCVTCKNRQCLIGPSTVVGCEFQRESLEIRFGCVDDHFSLVIPIATDTNYLSPQRLEMVQMLNKH